MPQIPPVGGFDLLAVERAVHGLSRTGVRASLTIERIKRWVKQFESTEEKTLAWLILRNLIFRSNEQLMSSMRQSLKKVGNHFGGHQNATTMTTWEDVLKGATGLSFYCGPPSMATSGFGTPGKSGEVLVRLVNQRYRIEKYFPSDIQVLKPEERFIVVDDGSFTGSQICAFLRSWTVDFTDGRIAVAVSIAHQSACEEVGRQFPNVPIFFGELLEPESCFVSLCQRWIDDSQWQYETSPVDVYNQVYARHQPFSKGNGPNGYGDIGALVAFEHGVPDDSIQLLWDSSPTWMPLADRGT